MSISASGIVSESKRTVNHSSSNKESNIYEFNPTISRKDDKSHYVS